MNQSDAQAERSPVRRKTPRYSLRFLLLLMAVTAVALAVWSSMIEPYRRQAAGYERYNRVIESKLAGRNVDIAGMGFDLDDSYELASIRQPTESIFAKSAVSWTIGENKYVDVTKLRFPPKCEANDVDFIIQRMPHLNLVALDRNDVSNDLLRYFASQQDLAIVAMRYCDITDEDLSQLRGAKIERLYLTGNPVTDDSIETLATLGGIKKLFLRWTGITAEGAEVLRSKLPNCEINHTR